jgi:arylsulfatase A-like enzyme
MGTGEVNVVKPVRNRSACVSAVLSATATAAIFDVAFSSASGALAPASYLLSYLGFSFALSATIIAVAAATRAPKELALGLWSGATVLLISNAAVAAGAALLVWLLVRLLSRDGETGIVTGGAVGAATGLAFAVLPEFGSRLAKIWPAMRDPDDVIAVVVLALSLAIYLACERLRARNRIFPAHFVLLLLTLALVIAPPLYVTRLRGGAGPPETAAPAPGTAVPPHVIVLIMDTVGAEHVSLYGYPRETTPSIARFVAGSDRAVVFPYAYAPGSWTVPSHASLFTGSLPSGHRAHLGNAYVGGRPSRIPLRAERTLAEVARQQGYRTAAVVANGMLFLVDGIDRGFDWWFKPPIVRPFHLAAEKLRELLLPDLSPVILKPYPSASSVNAAMLLFLDGCEQVPCFAVANYMEAHSPYVARGEHLGKFGEWRDDYPLDVMPSIHDSAEMREFLEARYDEEIVSLDEQIGILLAELSRRSMLDRSWLIITSDHGEAFGRHNATEHGTSLYDDQVRIPLIVQPPLGVELTPWGEAVSLLDVAATLSSAMGGDRLGVGRDLRNPHGTPWPVQMQFFGDTRPFRIETNGPECGIPKSAVVLGRQKLIRSDSGIEAYDLTRDPGELVNLRDTLPSEEIARLVALLPPLVAADEEGEPRRHEVSREQEEALRALGYIRD